MPRGRVEADPSPGPLWIDRPEGRVRLDLRLAEEAVLLAVERAPAHERRRFHAARDPLYELDEGARREARFAALHADWFERLRLAEPLVALLGEQPSIGRGTAACLVIPAGRRHDEHADLREGRATAAGDAGGGGAGDGAAPPLLLIQLLPATLIDPPRLERLLRRELTYAADMLDPKFGYDPRTAVSATSGPLAGRVRERHDLLWRVTVDGRLAARGLLVPDEVEALRASFEAAFPLPRPPKAASFRGLFEGPRPDHPELLALARDPFGGASGSSGGCPLCRMPSAGERRRGETLSARAIEAVRRDFADWRPADGLCLRCADLYELRERSRPTAS